jgi:hypothetical protein
VVVPAVPLPDLRPGDERTALVQRLDLYRATAAAALVDLEWEEASTRLLPATDLTIAGIVRHLAWATQATSISSETASRVGSALRRLVPPGATRDASILLGARAAARALGHGLVDQLRHAAPSATREPAGDRT